ncbi:hypothetical protein RUND412_011450, partial [Rhizina undulata]
MLGLRLYEPRETDAMFTTRGALIRGLDGSFVKDQIARRHYGVSLSVPYREGRGWEKYRVWDSTEETWDVPNQMRWIAEKGMVLEEGKTVSLEVYRNVTEGESRVFITKLQACNKDKHPSWRNPDDLSRLPLHTFEQHVNSRGLRYWKVSYSLEMK